ncbi:MAG: RNA methyltransferase [Treponema sp.]|nr:RNA methyltransferase [Treponema sp.]
MKGLVITSEDGEYQLIASLKNNRVKRKKLGEAFIEGIEGIKQAEGAGKTFTRLICRSYQDLSSWGKNFVRAHPEATLIEMKAELYGALCDREEPSELLATLKIDPLGAKDLLQGPREKPFYIVCDRPSDQGNLGALIRSANAFGVQGILIMGHGVDPWDPKVIRSSLGGIFSTRIAQMESVDELSAQIQKLKTHGGLTVIGTDSQGEVTLGTSPLAPPVMLIIGNEAKGMSIKLKGLCDLVVKIPMEGKVNSLNAACAASILIWEIYKNT